MAIVILERKNTNDINKMINTDKVKTKITENLKLIYSKNITRI